VRRRFGNSIALDPHPLDVELNGLAHEFTSFFERRRGCDAAWKIGDVRTITGGGRVKEDGVGAHFSPACFSIELCVLAPALTGGAEAPLAVPRGTIFSNY